MRDQLLDAVERLLAHRGVDALRLDAVATEAGVSKGGLLHHFPSKLALIQGVVERLADRFEAGLPPPGAPPGAFTRAWLTTTVPATADGERTADQVPLALLAAAGGPGVLEVLRERYTGWQQRLEQDGLDPAVSTLVRMAVDGWWTARLLGLAAPDDALHTQLHQLLYELTQDPGVPRATGVRRSHSTSEGAH
ncbi:TetR/AcrR family transcriptional regulator [Streptomyces sp. NPDC052396]|uniref:TetR/AcrR family transcriptional regulator n=1 Tax=Streptomyces sp. NPDC052396 TaxID=3365689 RepID=UPI0037D87B32